MSGGEGLTKKRNASFELLRIIAMLMIIVLHYNSHAGTMLRLGEPASGVNIFATLIESICITGINVYVFLSGYFLSQSKVKISRIVKLIAQVYFYTLMIPLVMIASGTNIVHSTDSGFKIVQFLFPISSEHYWFATAYVIMYVLAPVMNAAVNALPRKQLKWSIIGLLVWFCFIKSVVPVLFATDHFGYDFGWFLCLYLIAAYVRKYDVRLFSDLKGSFLVFAGSCFMIFAITLAVYFYNLRSGRLNHYFDVPMDYNYIFTLTGSLGLFSCFRFLSMREGRLSDVIRFIGPLTFGVYLLHMHIEIRDRWVVWMEHLMGEVPTESIILFAWHLVKSVVIVFLAGIFVDWIRKTIFDFIGRVFHDTWLFKTVRQWDKDL